MDEGWLECRLDERATISESIHLLGKQLCAVYDLDRDMFLNPELPVRLLHLVEGTRLLVY
ncbi:hypothetical protein [Galactobacillus timonensis]|uniref:hypothetical protein n=1 Tax=Galactobacillus timonensis TaxID=2041840 RepID=UPI001083C3B0|nr:hypothetical protein [Galactobacillus timonensis]